MSRESLSALDRSFLEVETETAHMHVGWAALFDPPPVGPPPSFEELRAHVASRVHRAPRYRQKLAPLPLGVGNPLWVDDQDFDPRNHVKRADSEEFGQLVDAVMSTPLDRGRPLWELWIAESLADGRLGVVGKAHHCMVDGIAAVELATLLLDPTPDPSPPARDGWRAAPAPGPLSLLGSGLRERVGSIAEVAMAPARLARSPGRVLGLWRDALRAGRALADAGAPATPHPALNAPISDRRHLASVSRPLADIRLVKQRFGTTVNDVVLAASAGGVRRFLERRGQAACPLKTMVPVNVRDGDGSGQLGNRISFVFVELPCHEVDPLLRLLRVHDSMSARKAAGDPEGADDLLKALGYAPLTVQRVVSKLVASPRAFNLTVSNIPGPTQPVFMHGCELEAAYPVVPIADRHGVSIGMTTIKDSALFGVYADRESVPDADLLAEEVGNSIDELVELSGVPRLDRRSRERALTPV